MDYTQLDANARLAAVRLRISQLEQQYLNLSLRISAPDLGVPSNPDDLKNLQSLSDSLASLHADETALSGPNPPSNVPAAPASSSTSTTK